jgi:predicted ribosomally synthesized peptide with nif11-like leader
MRSDGCWAIKLSFHAVVNAIAHIHIETPRLTKERFDAGGAPAIAVAGGVVLEYASVSTAKPKASCRPLGVSTAGSRSGRGRPARQGGRRRIGGGLGGLEGSWWLWEWLLLAGSHAIPLTPGRAWAIMEPSRSRPLKAMSEEQLKTFLEAVKADAGLQEKLKAAKDAAGVVAIAKAAGFAISVEELQKTQAELSEEELEAVTGVDFMKITN